MRTPSNREIVSKIMTSVGQDYERRNVHMVDHMAAAMDALDAEWQARLDAVTRERDEARALGRCLVTALFHAAAIRPWCARFPGRVHVARVNTWDRLILCYEAGAVSVDGTGWFRKENKGSARVQSEDLRRFLEMTSAERRAA